MLFRINMKFYYIYNSIRVIYEILINSKIILIRLNIIDTKFWHIINNLVYIRIRYYNCRKHLSTIRLLVYKITYKLINYRVLGFFFFDCSYTFFFKLTQMFFRCFSNDNQTKHIFRADRL
jgi:hypothetical protein